VRTERGRRGQRERGRRERGRDGRGRGSVAPQAKAWPHQNYFPGAGATPVRPTTNIPFNDHPPLFFFIDYVNLQRA